MSDALKLVFEEGYQACLSSHLITSNPYSHDDDYVNWMRWVDGYKTAELDNSTPSD